MSFKELAASEARFAMLARTNPAAAEKLFEMAQRDIDDQWHYYEQLSGVQREVSEQAGKKEGVQS
jgi:hypothetical protein